MKLKTAITHFSTILLLAISGTSQAVLTTYNNQASFLVDVGTATTYDFETGSGFPDASGGGFQTIGLFDGINFDATTFDAGASVAISGTQVMSGAGGSFTPATLTFAPGTTGLGFFALDLTIVGSEVIQLLVDFDAGPDQTFNIGLAPGDLTLTPKYFGLYDPDDSILSATLLGSEDENLAAVRAWIIDDLTVAPGSISPIPVPAAVWLFGTALIGLVGFSKRRKSV